MKSNSLLHFILSSLLIFIYLTGCTPPPATVPPDEVPQIRILIGNLQNTDTIRFSGTYLLRSEEAVYEFGSNNSIIYIESIENGYKIYNKNRMLRFRNQDKSLFFPETGQVSFTFRGKSYPGSFQLIKGKNNGMMLINSIQLEEYLKSVVPAEIYTGEQDLNESAKAQAICSRTYALKRMKERRKTPYDVHMDVRDQVYGGLTRQNRIASDAVDATRGIVLAYQDTLATVYFHSSCGGILENAVNVWENSSEPYLETHQDVLGAAFACRNAPNHRWRETRSIEQLDSSFQYFFGRSSLNKINTDTTEIALNMKITDRYPSGRVAGLFIDFADTAVTLSGYKIRRFLGWPPGQLLPSTLFRLTKDDDSHLSILGGGAGHGVGLCQWGAMHMSKEGFRYYHILGKYFKGCYLKKVY